ncbi:hypothetical protein M3Y98_01138300 [Aphelenchoides besseyi]|nr:hypothetical protein M3Y98_01138300 [Aphelenchoides besseyi]
MTTTSLGCHPSCDLTLPEIGKAVVRTKFDFCQKLSVLAISVKTGGKFNLETFIENNDMEIRPIRNNYWQLNLRVRFEETQSSGSHFVQACIENVRTQNLTCFMNGTLPTDKSTCSNVRNQANGSGFLWVLLCIIIITCLLMIGVSLFTIMHRFYSSHKSSGSRKPSNNSIKKFSAPRRPNSVLVHEPNSCLLSPHFFTDQRLDVIEEESIDVKSVASSSGVESGGLRETNEQRKHSAGSPNGLPSIGPSLTAQKASLLYQKDQVILPMDLTRARLNSQPLIFPASPSNESLKRLQLSKQQENQLPSLMNSNFFV